MAAFSLLRLPHIPLELVIELMKIEEQIKLSIISSRIEEFIKSIKYFVCTFIIHLKNDEPYFFIRRDERDFCDFRFNRIHGETFDTKHWINWYKNKSSYKKSNGVIDVKTKSPIEDVMNVSKRLRSLFKIEFLEWKLHMNKLTTDKIMELLPVIFSEKCDMVTIFNGNIEPNLLTHIMDTMPSEIRLEVDSDIPSDFKHEKAFTFYCSEYINGLWVKIQDLLPIRDRLTIKLHNTNFNYNDLYRFLCYWTNCEHDMMQYFFFKLRNDAADDISVLFIEFVLYQIYDEKTPTYYFLSNNEQKIRPLGRLRFQNNGIEFSTWSPTDYCAHVIPILKLLQRHRELQDKHEEVIEDKINLQKEWAQTAIGSTERESVDRKLREIQLQVQSMEMEFNEVVENLDAQLVTGFDRAINPIN